VLRFACPFVPFDGVPVGPEGRHISE
jgi:hypothetical protein